MPDTRKVLALAAAVAAGIALWCFASASRADPPAAGPSVVAPPAEPQPAPRASPAPVASADTVDWRWRVAWAGRVKGTPEPPPPYRAERAFPKLSFRQPLEITYAPGTDRLFLVEQSGRIFSIPNDQNCSEPDLFFDLRKELKGWEKIPGCRGPNEAFGLTFHPKFAENRYCYVAYALAHKEPGKRLGNGGRVSRFTVSRTDPPRIDPASEVPLLDFMEGGHMGSCLRFGPDGMLYISTGDASDPNPPDGFGTGQDISDLLSSILRIDVDRPADGKAYSVPPDNPFVKLPKARPEIWAYGLRNPWKMSFDRATGRLWVGDVGWEKWEMIYRVERGGNYGWSITEGPQPVRSGATPGPTPILPPALALPHPESASITGGYVYRGSKFPELVGTYIFGDWATRRIWGAKLQGDGLAPHRELAITGQQIIAFAEDAAGELLVLDYQGTIHRLVPNPNAGGKSTFPRTLSQTGLFASVKDQTPAPGVLPFSVNAPQWMDHATAERWIASPGTGPTVLKDVFPVLSKFFPDDTVLAKTVSMEMERGNPASRRRLETQILHFDGTDWRGYTFRWNDAQTDAALVDAAGADLPLRVRDASAPGGVREQIWHFPSRAECGSCHTPWSDFTLAFNPSQLNRPMRFSGSDKEENQAEVFRRLGLLPGPRDKSEAPPRALTDPYDAAADPAARARSYLHVNCAHCHQFGGGGSTLIDLRLDRPSWRPAHLIGERPNQGGFGLPDARVIAPGDPSRSVLFHRVAKVGSGRMPHIGSTVVDEAGVAVVERWIAGMKDAGPPVDPAAAARRATDARLLEELRKAGGPVGEKSDALLGSPSGALDLLRAFCAGGLAESVKSEVVARASRHPQEGVRDLFERFLPPDQRVRRLGPKIDPAEILALRGDPERGRRLFLEAAGGQCRNCHRIGPGEETPGPDLSKIGGKYNRAQILEAILDPSKDIDPKYVVHLLRTADGQVHQGFLVEKTDKDVVLRDAKNKLTRVAAEDVEQMVRQAKSMMPEQLLRDMTARQAADLVDFLASLK